MPNNFFIQNGKKLRGITSNKEISDTVTSIFEDNFILTEPSDNKLQKVLNKLGNVKQKINPKLSILWTSSSIILFLSVSLAAIMFPGKPNIIAQNKYFIYSSKPLTLQQSISSVTPQDSRAQKIDSIFKKYDCPLEGLGEVFVKEADKNNIPWSLVAAVSFQESGCGKNTPKVDGGQESYNAWGWGVYGETTHHFDNWARGIETVSAYFYNKFFSKGITDTCEIMRTYTPPSKGSWCNGVNEFNDMIRNFQTPQS